MSPVPQAFRPLLLTTAFLALVTLNGCASTESVACDSPGKEVAQALIVADSEPVRGEIVLVKCTSDRTITIVDKNDQRYGSLTEFQEDNELFAPDDRIFVPKNFPSVDAADQRAFGTETVPARVSTAWRWWLLGGGVAVVVVAAAVGGGIWLRRKRRVRESRDFSESLQELPEDDPKPGPGAD